MAPPAPVPGPSKGKAKAAAVVTHDESKTIRAQSKKDKTAPKQDVRDGAGLNKDVVKAVLASPLTTTWPNIPRHLQTAVLHALQEMVPGQVADYHVSRARCHTKERRIDKRTKRKAQKAGGIENTEGLAKVEEEDEDVNMVEDDTAVGYKRKSNPNSTAGPSTKKQRTEIAEEERPEKPEILSHLVLGINEVIKCLEAQIDELKLRLLIMADSLNPTPRTPRHSTTTKDLLPTAPVPALEADGKEEEPVSSTFGKPRTLSPLSFIVVPLLSINPQSLVYPIPSYCATYNALVYQHAQLAKTVKTRVKESEWEEVLGTEKREEVRVVPLGEVEKDMAQLVGLRRLACLGVKTSHPNLEVLEKLLPKSVLHPPRHSITLPFPTSSLKVHAGSKDKTKPTPDKNSKLQSNDTSTAFDSAQIPIPHVHYAPLHIKGIQTTVPVNNAARKAKRLEEVRKRRVEVKLLKKEQKGKGKPANASTVGMEFVCYCVKNAMKFFTE
ncbi:hypothetical protein IAR55_006054 [Kwoniella newhampshirensis]|uniref:Uncharacterized protein n=1 Tax=Kwoniella newhampshirensis TaxID=1651941 RepID=A0AAW0YUE2_9TREE